MIEGTYYIKHDIVQVRVADVCLYEAVGERHQRHFVTSEQNQVLSPDIGVTPGAPSAHLPVTIAAVRLATLPANPSRPAAPRLILSALSWTVPVPEPPGSSFRERVISLRQRYTAPPIIIHETSRASVTPPDQHRSRTRSRFPADQKPAWNGKTG